MMSLSSLLGAISSGAIRCTVWPSLRSSCRKVSMEVETPLMRGKYTSDINRIFIAGNRSVGEWGPCLLSAKQNQHPDHRKVDDGNEHRSTADVLCALGEPVIIQRDTVNRSFDSRIQQLDDEQQQHAAYQKGAPNGRQIK